MSLNDNKWAYLCFLAIGVISYHVFYDSFLFQQWQAVEAQHWTSDIPSHAYYVLKSLYQGHFPAYSLWYRLVALFSGYATDLRTISFVSIFMLCALTSIKYFMTYWILQIECKDYRKAALVAFALMIVMPILSFYMHIHYPEQTTVSPFHAYLGNLAPNQWHNSTLILAMPVNIYWFYYSVRHIHSERSLHFTMMGPLTILSILCKPNFGLAFIPVYCLALFAVNLKAKNYLKALTNPLYIAIPALLTLGYQWYYTFKVNSLFEHPTKTIFSPLVVWQTYSPHIVLSFFLSITFPLVVSVFYYKKIDKYLGLSWLTFLVATLMFALLAEYPYYVNANYLWGVIAANFILFLFAARVLIKEPLDLKSALSYLVLELHFLSGCFLLWSFFMNQTSLIL